MENLTCFKQIKPKDPNSHGHKEIGDPEKGADCPVFFKTSPIRVHSKRQDQTSGGRGFGMDLHLRE